MGEVLPCVVCQYREPDRGRVCGVDRDSITADLKGLPRRLAALALQLIPGPAAGGERVATSKAGSPTSARLDALSLLAPGTPDVSALLDPLVQYRHVTREVTVTALDPTGQFRKVRRQIRVWQAQTPGKTVVVDRDDQIGVLPPAEWLDTWVRAWRSHYRHPVPPRAYRAPLPASTTRPVVDAYAGSGSVGGRAALAVMGAVGSLYRQAVADMRVGKHDGHNGTRSDHASTPDPHDDEWRARFGPYLPRLESPARDVAYLLEHLDQACADDVGIGEFAAELRSLTAEITRVLGDQPADEWIGRCPTRLEGVDGDTGEPWVRTCGAGLWQDPYTGRYRNGVHDLPQIECPRCHTVWGRKPMEHLILAREIRRMWPIDRRRRYTADEIEALRVPRCPRCAQTAIVSWRDVTSTRDAERWWRPEQAICVNGCPEAARIM
jgi:hypothetical protein